MKSVVFLALLCCAATAVLAVPTPSENESKYADPWVEIFSKQFSSAIQARLASLFTATDKSSAIRTAAALPDPWVFPDTTHRMLWLFQDGEVNTFHPTVYGMSKSQLKFTVDLSNDVVSYSMRWPMVTMQGDYNLWIDKWTILGIWERRRGNGAYSHTFKNLDLNVTFQLEQRSDGRFGVHDLETSIGFEKCDVWSENYSINSRPITDWASVSSEWKVLMDQYSEGFETFAEEGLSAVLGVLFGWPYPLSHHEVINVLEAYGAEIIGRK